MAPAKLFALFAHFVVAPFSDFDSYFDYLGDFVILSLIRKVHYKMRFFYAIQIVITADGH